MPGALLQAQHEATDEGCYAVLGAAHDLPSSYDGDNAFGRQPAQEAAETNQSLGRLRRRQASTAFLPRTVRCRLHFPGKEKSGPESASLVKTRGLAPLEFVANKTHEDQRQYSRNYR